MLSHAFPLSPQSVESFVFLASCVQYPCTVCANPFISGSVTLSKNGGLALKSANVVVSSSRPSPLKFASTKLTIWPSVMLEELLPAEETRALKAERTEAEVPFVGLSTNVLGSTYSWAMFTVWRS